MILNSEERKDVLEYGFHEIEKIIEVKKYLVAPHPGVISYRDLERLTYELRKAYRDLVQFWRDHLSAFTCFKTPQKEHDEYMRLAHKIDRFREVWGLIFSL